LSPASVKTYILIFETLGYRVEEGLVKLPAASALDEAVLRQPAMHPPSRGRATPHQLLVLGIDSADIVAGVGGLICDSVRAGVHVEVYLEAEIEERALRILGVDGCELPHRFEFESDLPDAVFLRPICTSDIMVFAASSPRPLGAAAPTWGYGAASGR
jgi:hypothetical protein